MPNIENTDNNQPKERQPFKGGGLPALIGSLPVADHMTALAWIFANTPELPLWPQLPHNPRERMLRQFIEGLPGIVEQKTENAGDRIFFNINAPGFEEEQLGFYEEYLGVVEKPAALLSSRFQISRERAAGIYHLAETAAGKSGLQGIKGQVTGPFTMLTGISDQDDRLGYYDAAIRDIVVKGIAMKAAWQVRYFKERFPALPVLMFIDEPGLAGIGTSSFISIAAEDVARDLDEVISAVQQAGGLAGVHVCANTDWRLLLSSGIDILSFDAYDFFDRFSLSKDEIYSFLERGGTIAWGLVPTAEEEKIAAASPASLVSLWEKQAGSLVTSRWDLPALLRQTLITPSCGTGSLTPEMAGRVLSLTRDVAAALRGKYS